MDIWASREKSLDWLENKLHKESEILLEGFDYLEQSMSIFQKIGDEEGENQKGVFARICLVTLAKTCHLLLGCYSLALDGLAQESGALFRVLIEAYEKLKYLRFDNSRINEVLEEKLPSAGNVGKKISGEFQNLREYLNENSSHFEFKKDSIRHLLTKSGEITPIPVHSLFCLRTNIAMIFAFQIYILFEAGNCLFSIGFDANSFADEIEKWRDKNAKVFAQKSF